MNFEKDVPRKDKLEVILKMSIITFLVSTFMDYLPILSMDLYQ